MASEYDITRAFKRIENELMRSMVRNLERHKAEETELGYNWEQWQAIQLRELERYRRDNAQKFGDDFTSINKQIRDLWRATKDDAQTKEEAKILEHIKKGDFKPSDIKNDITFFGVNDAKLSAMIDAANADFTRAEYAMLRKANDEYRQIIFDAQMYAASGAATYDKAVDMATHDFLKAGIQNITYKNGARHTMPDYARMAIRTGNKRAYLMGEGNAHDKYGIHTVRVNKRENACPLCVGFLGRVLVDDVYSGGTAKEAAEKGVPTLSQAMAQGFLHPNCKDIYSLYIDGVSKPAEPWTQDEINNIVGDYNQDQEIQHADDMIETYQRMADLSLDETNKQRYQDRADMWRDRKAEIGAEPPQPVEPPEPPKAEEPTTQLLNFSTFTQDEAEALENYISGEGMWINQHLRGTGELLELNDLEKEYYNNLLSATSRKVPKGFNNDKLYRSVDFSSLFREFGLSEVEIDSLYDLLRYDDKVLEKYANKQGFGQFKNAPIGRVYTEKGFMSTTTDRGIAYAFNDFTGATRPMVLDFNTGNAKNLLGADARAWDILDDPQKEILLHPNTQYKITGFRIEETEEFGRLLVAEAELLGVEETAGATAAEAIVETVVETPKPIFTPATTIAEAEEYAKRFTDPDRFGALGVSYEGVSVDVANILNKTLGDFFDTYNIEPFGGIVAPRGNTKLGKLVDGATAGYSPIRHSFVLNRKSLKDLKTAEKVLMAERNAMQDILRHPEKYDFSKARKAVRDIIEAAKISGRSTVPMTVEEVAWHELGHSLERQINRLDNISILQENVLTFAPKISGYATSEWGEYIAESFCSYMKGEGLVDPELIKAFESLRRNP